MKNIREWKTVLLSQSDVDAVVGRRCLQFEVKSPAEAFPQRQSPGLVDAASEGRVDHQLHPAAFVKETLRDDRGLGRHVAQYSPPFQHILDQLLCARRIETALLPQPTYGLHDVWQVAPALYRRHSRQPVANLFPQFSQLLRKLRRTRRS